MKLVLFEPFQADSLQHCCYSNERVTVVLSAVLIMGVGMQNTQQAGKRVQSVA